MPGQATFPISRRRWMLGAASTWLVSRALADDVPDLELDPEAEAQAIEERARKVGLTVFGSVESTNYRVFGNASPVHLKLILGYCEAVATDFFAYYQGQGFEVDRPRKKLTALVFANLRTAAAFLGQKPPSSFGLYDRSANRFYVFDYRVNFVAHEAIHQLAYNSGLLQRLRDVPVSISEGIALYGETRKLDAASPPGKLNNMRLTDLAHVQRKGVAWIPLTRLITDDKLIQGSAGFDTTILAYAQSWLLVYYLMKEPDQWARFRDYLKSIQTRKDPSTRLEDARRHFGDLDLLDKDLRRYSIRLLKAN